MLDFWGVTKNYRQALPAGEPQTQTKSPGLCWVNYKISRNILRAAGRADRWGPKQGDAPTPPQKSSCTTLRRGGVGWMLFQIRWVVTWLIWNKRGSVHKINCITAAFKSPWQPRVYRQDDFIDIFIYTYIYVCISKMCRGFVGRMRNDGALSQGTFRLNLAPQGMEHVHSGQ